MAKITVTLTAEYDDGKAVKAPGDTISMDDKLAQQLAALGMVQLPALEADEAKEVKQTKPPKGKKTAATAAPSGGEAADGADPSAADLDPDAMGNDEE